MIAILLVGCHHQAPPASVDALEVQQARAAEPGPDQALELCRLASLALRRGELELAEDALRRAVGPMQDFRADGQFRALVGAESSKEWKGDPYEKMMAFLYLGLLLYGDEDYGNALAMTRSAVLADTGTSRFQYRADFVPAFVLQAMAYRELGEDGNADRSIGQAIDAMYVRELTGLLSDRLAQVELGGAHPTARPSEPNPARRPGDVLDEDAARALLLSALPAGLAAHPRDPQQAIDAALSRATDLRQAALDSRRRTWPDDLQSLKKRRLRGSFELLDPLVRGWREQVRADGAEISRRLAGDAEVLQEAVDHPPRLVLWVESGVGPTKVAGGRYGEVLRVVRRSEPSEPRVLLDGVPLAPTYLDSLTYQASTRGGRWVDGFLKGKAAFKDAAPFVGWALLEAGDVATVLGDQVESGELATALYLAGAAVWVAGAVANPRADTRAWDELPETLWLVVADPPPGTHEIRVDGVVRTVELGDRPVSMLISGGGG